MERFILSSSKGLAEATKAKAQTVQFIHESVRDFLLGENGLRKLNVFLDLGNSHENMKLCCYRYMNVQISGYLSSGKDLPKAKSTEARHLREVISKDFPFLEYAVQNVLFHADLADGQGISQAAFIKSFVRSHWILLDNVFQQHQVRRHTANASLLYILAEKNHFNLIQTQMKQESYPDVAGTTLENERYGTPLHAAVVNADIHEETIQALLFPSIQANSNGWESHNLEPY